MKRIKSKLAIAVIAVAAIGLIAGIGAYAYWSVSQQLAANSIASGHLGITVTDGSGGALVPFAVSNVMPGDSGLIKTYEILSTAGNPNTDIAFSIENVAGTGTLKDNVKVAFLLCTGGTYNYWLTPSGTVDLVGSPDVPATYQANAYTVSSYAGKSWGDLPGYTDIVATDFRHIKVYYYLPLECADDCHDSTATFDMSFELLQSH